MASAETQTLPSKTHVIPVITMKVIIMATLCISALAAAAIFHALRSSSAEPTAATSTERQQRLRQQLVDARTDLEEWQDWYRNLAAVDPYPGVGPGILRTANAQKALHDDKVTRLHDEPRLEGPPIGPFEVLVDIATQLRKREIDFIVLPVPPMAAVYPRRALDNAPPGDDIPPFLDWRLRAFYLALEAEGVEVIDLLPTFLAPPVVPEAQLPLPDGASGPSSVDLLYRYQDRHWTPLGSHIAAGVVARRVEQFPWFEETRTNQGQAVIHDHWQTATRRGRNARRLAVFGVLPPEPPAEIFLVRQARIEGEKWSLNDTDSPILLIGDSFSGLEHGFQDGLLVELGFRVDAITVPGGRPSAQLDALALRDSGLEGKRLVIWQFTTASLSKWHRWRSIDL